MHTHQKTYDIFDEEKLKMSSITESRFTCPHCNRSVRFIVQDGCQDMASKEQEIQHYRKLCEKLMIDNFNLRMYCRRLAAL